MSVALIISVLAAVAGCLVLAVLGRRPVKAKTPAMPMDAAEIRPALVNFVLTTCKPSTAAYAATILDLAARGFLGVASQPGGIWLSYAELGEPALRDQLDGHERRVLDHMQARLKNTGGAPFFVLADACRADVEGTWTPFEERLRTEARRRGVSHRRLPDDLRIRWVAFLTMVAVGVSAFLAVIDRPHGHVGAALFAALGASIVFQGVLVAIGWRDRLTEYGLALAVRWTQERAAMTADPALWSSLVGRAFAIAADVPGAEPQAGLSPAGQMRRQVRGGPSSTRKPAEAWSSFTGTWRLVPIRNSSRLGFGPGIAALVTGGVLGAIALALTSASSTQPWPLLVAAIGIGLGLYGIGRIAKVAQIPNRATFDGQVIARWQEESDSENSSSKIPHCAIDDGQQAWTFSGSVADRVALEDLVRCTVNPRTGALVELNVTRHVRPESTIDVSQVPGGPPGGVDERLLTSLEVASLIGPVIRNTPIPSPSGYSTVFRSSHGSLSVHTAAGTAAAVAVRVYRKRGQPLPGIGDAAWLLAKENSVVASVGQHAVRLTLQGADPPPNIDLLVQLTARAADRLRQDVSRHPSPQART